MAKLENYNGSIEVVAGFKQKNDNDFPLMEAHSIVVDDDEVRLDEKLLKIDDKIEAEISERKSLGDNIDQIKNDISDNNALAEKLK
jgi:hypothetical protein